jgi:CubicO group peptidase (beta-lactamase class C family)
VIGPAHAGPIATIADEQGLPLVATVDVDGERVVEVARGEADRRCGRPISPVTRFALASGTKAFTAVTVMSLVADGTLSLDEPVRGHLGPDLPSIDDRVTIEHLLSHWSGIGDYLDEDAMDGPADYVMQIPLHRLHSAESYLQALDGFPQVDEPGRSFVYNNGGYVVLAIVAERAAGRPYAALVEERAIAPAELQSTSFERADELPPDVAIGYLELTGFRTNSLHIPLIGVGDGGLSSTVDDIDRWWRAFYSGALVPADLVDLMVTPRSTSDWGPRYGLGLWLDSSGPVAMLEGADAGISFRSLHDPTTRTTATVISNTSLGAWPVARLLLEQMFGHGA